VRKDFKVVLGDNGRSWMMARGYGDIGELKKALFVPGLVRDLISTARLDLEGMEESTSGGVKKIWSGKIGCSKVLMRFELEKDDLFYHWVDPYPDLAAPRRAGENLMVNSGTCMHQMAEVRDSAASPAEEDGDAFDRDRRSCTDARLRLRAKIRKLASERCNGLDNSEGTDPKLRKLVKSEVRKFLRGSRGVQSAETTLGLNKLQLLHLRLGHVSKEVILKMLKSGAAIGLGTTYDECKDLHLGICDACLRGKSN
jgi:hypothetical protein